MADYKGIKGFKVQSLASDPSAPIGQVWYNTTTNVLKYQALGAGTWSSGGNCNTGRAQLAGAGILTAGMMFCGIPFPTPGVTGKLQEEYNGSAWTEVAGEVNTASSYFPGWGTTTAAMKAGGNGYPPGYLNETETWNGTSWTEEADLNVERYGLAGGGTTTAALVAGGRIPPSGSNTDVAEEYNGTSWTAVGVINTARRYARAASSLTTTAGLIFGGLGPAPKEVLCESFNGTSWTEEADLGSARYQMGGSGTSTNALCFGGATPGVTLVEAFNGTAWTEVADLGSPRYAAGFGGNSGASDAFVAAGYAHPPANQVKTQEWTKSATVKTVTVV